MLNTMWVLMMEWFDVEGKEYKPSKYYFFESAEKALDYAYDVCHFNDCYEKVGKPYDMYLFKCEPHEGLDEGGGYYQAAWFDLDKKIRN